MIIAIDGRPTDNLKISDVAEMLKGPKGTSVRIAILHQGASAPLEFRVVRDEIARSSLTGGRRRWARRSGNIR